MIIYADGNGKILNAVQERVFQGAAGSYRLGLVSPFPETDAVTASFTLSGGKTCPPVLLSTDFSLSGIRDDNGAPLVVRSALFPSPVLSEHGRVKVQFHVRYNGQAGAEIFALEPFVLENLPARGESGVLYLRVDDAGESLFELFTYASGAWQSKGSVALHLSGSRAFAFTLKAQNWAQNKQVFTAEGLAAAEISVYPDDDSAKEYLTCGVEASAESGNVVFTAKRAPQSDLGVTLVAAPMTDELYAGYYSKRETDAALTAKQDVLSFDAAPTQDSTNALSSGAVYLALEDVRAEIQEKTPKYEAGKGLVKTDNTFSVVLDAASDEALRLTSAGLRLDLSDYSTTVESDTKLSGAYTRINSVATLAEGNAERIAAAEQTSQNHEETLSALETQAAGMLGRIAALEEGASFTEELVLPVSAWQNKTAVFDSAALAALSSLTAGSFVGAAPAAGYAAAFLKNNVRLVSVGAGTLTFTADTVPSTELRAILTAVI